MALVSREAASSIPAEPDAAAVRKGHPAGRSRRALAWAALVLGAAVIGCVVDLDLSGSRLMCGDGRCPGGFSCVEERCVPGEGTSGQDAGGEETADAAPEDAAPEGDAAPPDAPPGSLCDEQYGETPGYLLCNEDRLSCQFFVNTAEAAESCTALCAAGGGGCIAGSNADPGVECQEQEETECDLVLNSSQLCTCTLGPGPGLTVRR